jgi:hypothetical protein
VGNLWVTIEGDSAGSPSGTALATSDKFDVSVVPTTRGWIRFIFRTPVSLSASTQYHIVLQGDWAMNGTNVVSWRGDGTGYANGSGKKFDGTNWAAAGVADFSFKTYITQNDTAVTMPSGYDQRALIGYVYNNSSSNFVAFTARDRDVHVDVINQVLVTGGTSTYQTLIDAAAFIPPVPVTLTTLMLSGLLTTAVTRIDARLTTQRYESGVLFWPTVAAAYNDVGVLLPVEFQHLYYCVDASNCEIYLRSYRW